jgi:hypothetical protein
MLRTTGIGLIVSTTMTLLCLEACGDAEDSGLFNGGRSGSSGRRLLGNQRDQWWQPRDFRRKRGDVRRA